MKKKISLIACFLAISLSGSVIASPLGNRIAKQCFDSAYGHVIYGHDSDPYVVMTADELKEWNNKNTSGVYEYPNTQYGDSPVDTYFRMLSNGEGDCHTVFKKDGWELFRRHVVRSSMYELNIKKE